MHDVFFVLTLRQEPHFTVDHAGTMEDANFDQYLPAIVNQTDPHGASSRASMCSWPARPRAASTMTPVKWAVTVNVRTHGTSCTGIVDPRQHHRVAIQTSETVFHIPLQSPRCGVPELRTGF